MIDQSSARRFSTGVPVSARRDGAGRERTATDCRALLFLMACASSRTMRRQGMAASVSRSRVTRPYVVSTTSVAGATAEVGSPASRSGPWWTWTRRSGAKRANSRPQLPTHRHGADDAGSGRWRGGRLTRERLECVSLRAEQRDQLGGLAQPHVVGQAGARTPLMLIDSSHARPRSWYERRVPTNPFGAELQASGLRPAHRQHAAASPASRLRSRRRRAGRPWQRRCRSPAGNETCAALSVPWDDSPARSRMCAAAASILGAQLHPFTSKSHQRGFQSGQFVKLVSIKDLLAKDHLPIDVEQRLHARGPRGRRWRTCLWMSHGCGRRGEDDRGATTPVAGPQSQPRPSTARRRSRRHVRQRCRDPVRSGAAAATLQRAAGTAGWHDPAPPATAPGGRPRHAQGWRQHRGRYSTALRRVPGGWGPRPTRAGSRGASGQARRRAATGAENTRAGAARRRPPRHAKQRAVRSGSR